MYLSDLHTHSILSPDGQAPLADMARAALRQGFSAMILTDHFDLLDGKGTRCLTFDWTESLEQFSQTAPAFQDRLTLGLGLELGSLHISPDHARAVLAGAGDTLDMVIGSLHNWREEKGGGEYYYTRFSTPEICAEALDDYFTSMEELVAYPDCYDVLGHIIYPLRYMRRDGNPTTLTNYRDRLAEILRQVIATGRAIEVNTCRGNTVRDWHDILLLYRDLGGTLVTTGSDAHFPEDVGKGIRESLALLQECGFTHVTHYTHRTPTLIEI